MTEVAGSTASEAALACPHARDFTIYDVASILDPYPALGVLRDQCPVARSDSFGGYWIVSRYDDIRYVLQHPEIFSSAVNTIPPRKDVSVGVPIPLNTDPPEHTMYRDLLEPLVSPKVAQRLEPRIREEVRKLVTAAVARGSVDFVAEVATPLPALVFLPLLGINVAQLNVFLDLHRGLLATTRDKPENRGYSTQVRTEAEARLHTMVNELLDQRLALGDAAPDDILTTLARATRAGARPLSRDEVLRTVKLLFAAALDTVKSTLSMSTYFLATHPEHRRQLIEDPTLIPAAVEEFIRFFSPAPTGRLVLREVTVGGVTFQPGDMVLVPIVSANHDAAHFPNPEEIDFRRRPNAHVGFGAGPHRCLGSHLARMELRVAFEEIHRMMPEYRLANQDTPNMYGGAIVGIDALDLVIGDA